jgi:hypothetical protein
MIKALTCIAAILTIILIGMMTAEIYEMFRKNKS